MFGLSPVGVIQNSSIVAVNTIATIHDGNIDGDNGCPTATNMRRAVQQCDA